MSSVALNVLPKKSVLPGERLYCETTEKAASYNARLCADRKLRLPFLDSQTGVAQNHSSLLMFYRYRRPGIRAGQIYSFPARQWKKKKRNIPLPDMQPSKIGEPESCSETVNTVDSAASVARQELETFNDNAIIETAQAHYKEYYEDWENISEPPDAGEIDDRNSDSSDFEETYIKKRKKKGKQKAAPGGGRGRKKQQLTPEEREQEDKDKPYSCDMHHSMTVRAQRRGRHSDIAVSIAERSRYCDFCLGDEVENKKTGQREELVSCADCGRSGHPSCLQFTANMIISVKKYPWQCIECKSCGLCGTSDNDDQLLFCDDCDRGYHMYCLNPPLSSPPDGSWSCHLCIVEFYGGQKPPGMQ